METTHSHSAPDPLGEILRSFVRTLLAEELQDADEADYWSIWIADRLSRMDMLDYLDLDNRHPEDAANIIARLGFDPRTAMEAQ